MHNLCTRHQLQFAAEPGDCFVKAADSMVRELVAIASVDIASPPSRAVGPLIMIVAFSILKARRHRRRANQ